MLFVQELNRLAEEFKPEKFAPPAPPSPTEIGAKVGDLLAAVLSAPTDVLGTVKGILDRATAEIRKGPLPK